jgi:hypothetical protein
VWSGSSVWSRWSSKNISIREIQRRKSMTKKEMEAARLIFDIFMIVWIIINPGIKKLGNIIKLMDLNIQAIDRGIEESLKNGYAEARDTELRRLMDKEKFKRNT